MSTTAPKLPENLQEVLTGNLPGYELKTTYFLELDHSLMGRFPALYKETEKVVLTPDEELIRDVWKTMPPRRSKLGTINYYVNEEQGIGFPVLGTTAEDYARSKPQKILCRTEFERLTENDSAPFEWAPGLISNDMSAEEFEKTIEQARRQLVHT